MHVTYFITLFYSASNWEVYSESMKNFKPYFIIIEIVVYLVFYNLPEWSVLF